MDTNQQKKAFNRRAFVSITMFVAGLALPVSGIMNHNLQIEQLTAQRHFWMSVHNMSAFLFTMFAIIHVVYNRRSLWHYAKKVKGILISKEALAAIMLVAGIVALFSSHVFHMR
jgi:hypothetical protein